VQVGYNWQRGSGLIGIESDFDFADNLNYLISVRGRIGWALGSWLLYGTGGVAFIDTDNDFVVVSLDDGSITALPIQASWLAVVSTTSSLPTGVPASRVYSTTSAPTTSISLRETNPSS
jgi:opacity protein-like surface antigen